MTYSGNPPHMWDDFLATTKSCRVWHLLAMQDIRQRYRRSLLGPFWLTLSTFISIGALALVYTKIFKMPVSEYLPFLTVGFIFWTFISGILIESCGVFIAAEGIIKQINLPFGVHVMRMIWRNLIILAHHSIVLLAVLAFSGIALTKALFLFPFSLLLVVATSVFLGYLLGALCTRFRDIAQVISSLVQVIFYVTPVIWKPVLLKGHENLLVFNPFFHYLEILRAPVLGVQIEHNSWVICIAMTSVFGLASMMFTSKYRKRIAYWL